MRELLTGSISKALQQFESTGDSSTLFNSRVQQDARALSELFLEEDQDIRAREVLGWYHWHRSQVLTGREAEEETLKSLDMFSIAFTKGLDNIPDQLIPILLNELTFPVAIEVLEDARASGDLDLFTTAEYLWRRILAVAHHDAANWPSYNRYLGTTLIQRFDLTEDLSDLDAAIAVYQEGFDAVANSQSSQEEDLAEAASLLGTALLKRHRHSGEEGALGSAIWSMMIAVTSRAEDDERRPGDLCNLAQALQERYSILGDSADLNSAIDALSEALNLLPERHTDRSEVLFFVASATMKRFAQSQFTSDLEIALRASAESVRLTDPNDPQRPLRLSQLAFILDIRARTQMDENDRELATAAMEAALSASEDNESLLASLSMLSRTMTQRVIGDPEGHDSIDAAIDSIRTSIELDSQGKIDQGTKYYYLGKALRSRYERDGNRADLDKAVDAFITAYQQTSSTPIDRLRAIWEASRLIAPVDLARAATFAEDAVNLVPLIAARQLGLEDKQRLLQIISGLASEAAALAMCDHKDRRNAARALRLLETGRGIILGQGIEARAELTRLREFHPELANRYMQLRDKLEAPEIPATDSYLQNTTGILNSHAREFEEVLQQIRALPDFPEFGLPPAVRNPLKSRENAAIVLFNVTQHRSDAILITPDGLLHCGLPDITEQHVREQTEKFQDNLQRSNSRDQEVATAAQKSLHEVLRWLWDAAVGPVLDMLSIGPACGDNWPRIWWIPGGLLSLLPVHAAGYHDANGRRTGKNALDRVVSSYAPSVRSLSYARERHELQPHVVHPNSRSMVVAMPTTPGFPNGGALNFVDYEVEEIFSFLPNTTLLRSSGGTVPTKQAVLNLLPECTIAHFTCHGDSDPHNPSNSMLYLEDHQQDPFTVDSLTTVRLDQAQLAFLSACRTASGSARYLVDESIHLTSAFHIAGFRHVVGTLWEISDQTAAFVASKFYSGLTTQSGGLDVSRSARALHDAVRTLRDHQVTSHNENPSINPKYWTAYMHVGA